jgi:integrase
MTALRGLQGQNCASLALRVSENSVREVWAGIRRTHGTAQQGKAPVLIADLRDMLAQLPDSLLGTRDRALLLLGFAGAFRRSELVGLDVAAGGTKDGRGHVEFTRDGLVVTLTRSKTDQEGVVRPSQPAQEGLLFND